ncbi:MAG: hypothetical protein JRJ20_03730 [Deltaproteobacteria bacterium]|nr:hypothetical protein [Deltaproteobacteria bacterium]
MDPLRKYLTCWVLTVVLTLCGCAYHKKITPVEVPDVYTVQSNNGNPATRFAPMFLVYGYQNDYNRIGQPSARYGDKGKEHIFVDIDKPVFYYMERQFSTDKGQYTNYIYRVHFPEVPFSLVPFYLTSGNNVGLMISVTVDSENRPVLITSVHTCGCYLTIVPTSHLPPDSLPENWKKGAKKVYGEILPGKLDYTEKQNPKLLVYLRPDVHRVMNLEIIEDPVLDNGNGFKITTALLVQMEDLKRIPIDGKTTSFYHNEGLMKGHVKGSVKYWESIFMSLVSLDLFVGTDKAYADTEVTGNPFYTSLKPWNRNSSNIWNFARFLEFWGWEL